MLLSMIKCVLFMKILKFSVYGSGGGFNGGFYVFFWWVVFCFWLSRYGFLFGFVWYEN